ncbi:calcineurin B homologous protein 3 isoform X2 [Protopterus annectens]|uniref:calcineurin B homologous protein 3 isoform X2 n=1 Tax=Protopterus annectens TaxID=7888 RepID=UPI001CFBEA2A|nr:calcineurin B homologous protein 3 isoform X2 [Protopterus annectens]
MGSSHSISATEIQQLSKKTGFTSDQIEILHRRFKYLSEGRIKLRKNDFHRVSNLESNPIREKIVNAFFDNRNLKNEPGTLEEIEFGDFLTILSNFRPVQVTDEADEVEQIRINKLRFLFNMYDCDGDGKISVEEYKNVVSDLLSKSLSSEKDASSSVAEAAMLEARHMCSGHVIWKDISIESQMYVRFLTMETTRICK